MNIDPVPAAYLNDPLRFVIDDVEPNAVATVTASATDARGTYWESVTEYRADSHGRIDISSTLPIHADWHKPVSVGMIWTMKADKHHRPFALGNDGLFLDIKVRCEGKGMGTRAIRRIPEPAQSGPTVLVMGDARGLAGEGFNAIEIPVDLEKARQAVEKYDDPAIVAQGEGTEVALTLAAEGVVNAVVAHAPRAVRTRDWGDGKPYLAPEHRQHRLLHLEERYFWDLEDTKAVEAAAIPLEKAAGPILLTAGGADKYQPSSQFVNMLVDRAPDVEIHTLVEPAAGHYFGFPFAQPGLPQISRLGPVPLGGSDEANGLACERSMMATVSFLKSYYGLGE